MKNKFADGTRAGDLNRDLQSADVVTDMNVRV